MKGKSKTFGSSRLGRQVWNARLIYTLCFLHQYLTASFPSSAIVSGLSITLDEMRFDGAVLFAYRRKGAQINRPEHLSTVSVIGKIRLKVSIYFFICSNYACLSLAGPKCAACLKEREKGQKRWNYFADAVSGSTVSRISGVVFLSLLFARFIRHSKNINREISCATKQVVATAHFAALRPHESRLLNFAR